MMERRRGAHSESLDRNIAMAIAAGWAITCTAPRFFIAAFSANGARRRAFGCSSSAEVRSISAVFLGAILSALRLDACDPARNATLAPSKLGEARGTITTGSSFSEARGSPTPEINSTRGAGFVSPSNSRNSRASNVSPPTTATKGLTRKGSANLMLRFRRWRLESPPHDATNAYDDSACHVSDRHRQQRRFREAPDQKNRRADNNKRQRRTRAHQAQIFETRIAPRAHHQEGQQRDQRQPRYRPCPNAQRSPIARIHDARYDGRPRRDRQADEIFAIRPARIFRHRIFLDVESRQTHRAAQQKDKGEEIARAVQIFEILGIEVDDGLHELHSPHERQRGRCDPECNDVGERIHLPPKITDGIRHARDAAVEAVEEHRQANGQRCLYQMLICRQALRELHGSLKNFDQCVKAKKYIARGKEGRQRIGRAARMPLRRFGIDEAFPQVHDFFLAITLDPAETRWPTRTTTSHSGPSCTSTRDPNLIRPTRSPAAKTSPGFL